MLRSCLPIATLLATLSLPAIADETPTRSPPAVTAAGSPAPFAPGEQIDLAIDYLHVRTAKATLIVGRPEGTVWPVICQGKTDGIAALLDIREHYVSYWDASSGLSRGSDLNAIEIGDRHTDRARYDRENGKAVVRVIRKGKAREVTHDVPRDVQDLAGALLFLRRQALARDAHFELPVFSGSKTFTLRADVEGEETVETSAGRFDTFRVRVQLGFDDKFKTSRDSHVWFSKDLRHIPVRMSADFAVGTVTATITGYRPGMQYATAR